MKLTERITLRFAAFACVYAWLAWRFARFVQEPGDTQYLWPAGGVALAAWIILRRARPPVLVAVAGISTLVMVGTRASESSLWAAALLGALHAVALYLSGSLVQWGWNNRRHFDRTTQAFWFLLVAGVVVPLACGATAAAIQRIDIGMPFGHTLLRWAVAHALSNVVIGAFLIAWLLRPVRTLVATMLTRPWDVAGAGAGLVAAAAITFSIMPNDYGNVPMYTYLSTPFVLWAALRLGTRGTTLAVALLCAIGLSITASGRGIFAATYALPGEPVFQASAYLLVLASMALLVCAVTNERKWALARAHTWQRRFEAASQTSDAVLYEWRPQDDRFIVARAPAAWFAPDRVPSTLPAFLAHVDERDRERVRDAFRDFARDQRNRPVEYLLTANDGATLHVEQSGERLMLSDMEGLPGVKSDPRVIGFIRDISARKQSEIERNQLQAALARSERLQAIGRLAGSIAHDFNNILGAVLGYGELARKRLKASPAPDTEVARHVDTIVAAGERGRSLVEQVFQFSRSTSRMQTALSLSAVIEEVCALVHGSMPPNVTLDAQIKPDITLTGDATRLHQLAMNLVTNSMKALAERGGTVKIELRRTHRKVPRPGVHGETPPGKYILLAVSDNGPGIPAELRERIFEPFYSNQSASTHGLTSFGLGLMIVQTVAADHGALLELTSTPGSGTTFNVLFPHRDESQPDAAPQPFGDGRVLMVVDDEPAMLELMEEALATLGFEPIGFSDPLEAERAFNADPERFDGVVSDEVMPGITGTELVRALHEKRPSLPAILVSGYGGIAFETRALAAGVNTLLRKPFSQAGLAKALLDAGFGASLH